jgi:two-component system chemotaxis sensor kinase CheA
MLDKFMASFKIESKELLDELEASLLELERCPADTEAIGRVFRAMHTIKGLAASFGFEDIATFSHEVENVFALVRNGRLAVDKKLIDLTLRARDWISTVMETTEEHAVTEKTSLADTFRRISEYGADSRTEQSGCVAAEAKTTSSGKQLVCRVRFRPTPDIFTTGPDPRCLFDELSRLGECSVIAHLDDIPDLESISPEKCYTYWDIVLATQQDIRAVRDVFIFVEDNSEVAIEILYEGNGSAQEPTSLMLGQILVERGDLSPEDVAWCLSKQKRLGEIALDEGLISRSHVEAALLEQQAVRGAQPVAKGPETDSMLRVASEKLDKLVDLVGELVTASARLNRLTGANHDSPFAPVAEEIERLTDELRDTTMNIRMVPIGETFGKFKRLVRDLAGELGKEVDFITTGEETELDKTVIGKLSDPLMHIIRNCVDHGIEPPGVRETAGKGRRGIVVLTASHSMDSVVITIQDDGAGLDPEAIRAVAVGKGIIGADVELTERELTSLIFAPGFSTVKKVTDVSGRGVGMDVVKRAIDGLRGTIEISSRRGAGTVITIRLPLTLAIIESLLVKIGEGSFVLPLSSVEECIEHVRGSAGSTRLADVRGSLIPYIPLRDRFAVVEEAPEIQQIVIMRVDDERIGFVVDEVVGEHQAVIKSLGRACREIKGVSGATILGDGTVALILDVASIAAAEKELFIKSGQSYDF